MIRLLIAHLDPTLDVLMEIIVVSEPLLVSLVATTLTAFFMADDCEADFACFYAPHTIRISDTVLAVEPPEMEVIVGQELRFTEGRLVELLVDGLAQVRRIEEALRHWPVSILHLPSPERLPILKLA